jgi:hypothetical protein
LVGGGSNGLPDASTRVDFKFFKPCQSFINWLINNPELNYVFLFEQSFSIFFCCRGTYSRIHLCRILRSIRICITLQRIPVPCESQISNMFTLCCSYMIDLFQFLIEALNHKPAGCSRSHLLHIRKSKNL